MCKGSKSENCTNENCTSQEATFLLSFFKEWSVQNIFQRTFGKKYFWWINLWKKIPSICYHFQRVLWVKKDSASRVFLFEIRTHNIVPWKFFTDSLVYRFPPKIDGMKFWDSLRIFKDWWRKYNMPFVCVKWVPDCWRTSEQVYQRSCRLVQHSLFRILLYF